MLIMERKVSAEKWHMVVSKCTGQNCWDSFEDEQTVDGKVDWKGRRAIKYKHGGFRSSLLILATLGFESVATLSLAVNLVTYFNGVMHFELADAANELTNYMGTGLILSILVAVLADTIFGRFRAVITAALLEFLGLVLLTVQAHYPKLRPPICDLYDQNSECKKVEGANSALFFIGLYILASGTRGIKAVLPTHGADQFDEKDPMDAKQMSTFFNLLLLALCIGGAVSLTLFVWVQDNKGWDWGFGLSTVAIFLAVIIFLTGWPMYRIQLVQGSSALTEIIQVYVAAIRNRNLKLPDNPLELYEIDKDKEAAMNTEFLPHRDILRFLDKAAIIQTKTGNEEIEADSSSQNNPWKLCRVTQVENAKIILNMLPVFGCTIIMTLCLAQLQTFSIQQGLTMDTSIGSFHIPPASLPIIPVGFLIIIIPFYDQVIVPLLCKVTGIPTGITHLQRIGIGLILSAISMAIAAAIEVKRKAVARHHNMLDAKPVLQPLPISTFWLSIQYFVFGIADMFTYVGLLEFFYSEAPKPLKSISTCFLWSSMAIGYFLSTIIVKIINAATMDITRSGGWLTGNNINRNHLNLFFLLLSIMSLVNFCVYLIVAMRYRYRPQALVSTKA